MPLPGRFPSAGEAKRKGGPGPPWLSLARLRDHSDFPSRQSCAPWHALSARPARSVPAPLLPKRPANQRRGQGAAPREPAPPPRGTAGSRTKGRGRGRGTPLYLLSPRGLRPSNSRFLKEPCQGEEPRPGRGASSGSCLAAPDRFAPTLSFLGTCPEPLLIPQRGLWGAYGLGRSPYVTHGDIKAQRRWQFASNHWARDKTRHKLPGLPASRSVH